MAKKTIKVKKYSDVIEELTATAVAIRPGELVEITSAGTIQAHSTAGGSVVPPMFVLEDELQGKAITDSIAASAKAQCWIPYRGDQVYAWLEDGETAVIGSLLESSGSGTLKVHVPDVESFESADPGSITVVNNQIVGVALEAVDLSTSANLSADGRIIIRVV